MDYNWLSGSVEVKGVPRAEGLRVIGFTPPPLGGSAGTVNPFFSAYKNDGGNDFSDLPTHAFIAVVI